MNNDNDIEIKILGLASGVIVFILIVGIIWILANKEKPEVCEVHSFIKDEYWIMTMKSNDAKEFLRRPTLVCKECGIVRYEIKKDK